MPVHFWCGWEKSKTAPFAPSTPTRDNRQGEILKSAGVGGLGARGAAVGSSLFFATQPSVLFRPSARPRPSRAAGTFPLAWPGMNQPSCAARRRHVTTAGGRCGPDAPPLPSQADSRAGAPTAKDKRSPAPSLHPVPASARHEEGRNGKVQYFPG